jgi:hypothetical protein
MLTNSEKEYLKRIEGKVDRLLSILAPSTIQADPMEAALYASGGVKVLKEYIKSESERRASHAARL